MVVLNRSVPGLLANRFTQPLFRESTCLIGQGITTAGQGFYNRSEEALDDFRRRKQSPYFSGVREWTMPE